MTRSDLHSPSPRSSSPHIQTRGERRGKNPSIHRVALALVLSAGLHTGLMAMPLENQVRPPVPLPSSLSIRLADSPLASSPEPAMRDLPAPPAHLFAAPPPPVPLLPEPVVPPRAASVPKKSPRPAVARPADPLPCSVSSDTVVATAEGTATGNRDLQATAGGSSVVGTASESSGTGGRTAGNVVARPRYNRNPFPPYPSMARRRGYEGTVVLEVFVKENGSVGDLRVEASSSHPILDKTALDAVRTWKFEPGRENNRIVAMWVKVPVRFSLR